MLTIDKLTVNKETGTKTAGEERDGLADRKMSRWMKRETEAHTQAVRKNDAKVDKEN